MNASRSHIVASLFAVSVTAFFLSLGPGCIGYSEDVCEAGERCECEGIGECVRECDGPDCDFYCEGTGRCDFACPEGGCIAYCKGQGECTLSCPGGDCTLHCLGTGSCGITECNGACDVLCGTIGECTNE